MLVVMLGRFAVAMAVGLVEAHRLAATWLWPVAATAPAPVVSTGRALWAPTFLLRRCARASAEPPLASL
jgi:hypothetical protein